MTHEDLHAHLLELTQLPECSSVRALSQAAAPMLSASEYGIRKWLTGERSVPGPVALLVTILLTVPAARSIRG